MNIILIGPPGSGKGTVAEFLEKKYKLFHLSTGQMLRNVAKERADIAEILTKGQLVPDDLILSVLKDYIETNQILDNFILDGTPRTLYQYEDLKKWLKEKNTKFDMAIYLKVSDEEVINRLSNRRTHAKTGEIYNLVTNPPPEEIDPNDLIQRSDDTTEGIKKRLEVFHTTTKKLLQAMQQDDILVNLNAQQPIEGMLDEAEIIVNNYLKQKNAQN